MSILYPKPQSVLFANEWGILVAGEKLNSVRETPSLTLRTPEEKWEKRKWIDN